MGGWEWSGIGMAWIVLQAVEFIACYLEHQISAPSVFFFFCPTHGPTMEPPLSLDAQRAPSVELYPKGSRLQGPAIDGAV